MSADPCRTLRQVPEITAHLGILRVLTAAQGEAILSRRLMSGRVAAGRSR